MHSTDKSFEVISPKNSLNMSLIFAFPLHRQTIYVLFSPHKFVEQEENNAQEA